MVGSTAYLDALLWKERRLFEDWAHGRLTINAVYTGPHAPATRQVARTIARAVEGLAGFLGATDIA